MWTNYGESLWPWRKKSHRTFSHHPRISICLSSYGAQAISRLLLSHLSAYASSWLPSVFRPLFIPCPLPFPYHPHQCPYFKSLVYLKYSWMYDFSLEWGWLTKDCNKDYTPRENCLSLPHPATNNNQQLHDLRNSIVKPVSFSMLWVWFTWAHIAAWFQFYDSVIWYLQ